MVKIRVEGLENEVAAIVAWMKACFVVVDESPVYRNRPPSQFVRVYITVKAEQMPERKDHGGI